MSAKNLPKIHNYHIQKLPKNFPKNPQKSFMKQQTKTLSKLCEEQKPFYVQKFDTTPEEQERIIKEVVKERIDYIDNILAGIKIVKIDKKPSKFWSTIKRFLQLFNNKLTK